MPAFFQDTIQCKLCDRSFSTTPELDIHTGMYHKDSSITVSQSTTYTSLKDCTVEYQPVANDVIATTPEMTTTTSTTEKTEQQQTLPPVNSMTQPQVASQPQQQQQLQQQLDQVSNKSVISSCFLPSNENISNFSFVNFCS